MMKEYVEILCQYTNLNKEKICTALKIAAILAGILIYYLAEYRDIHRLYIPYAVIVWGIWYYFKEEYSWEKWIDREIIHFPYDHAAEWEKL